MNWWKQVVHVLRRDIAASWWLALAYVVVVATRLGAMRLTHPNEILDVVASSSILVLLGGALVARAIMTDPPERAGAYWSALPIAPSAVASAKVLLLLAVVGIGLLGEGIGLTWLAVPRHQMGPVLGPGLAALLVAMLFIGILAGVARSTWALLGLAAMIPLTAVLFFSQLNPLFAFRLPTAEGRWPMVFLILIGALGVLLWLYGSSARRVVRWTVAISSTVVLGVVWSSTRATTPPLSRSLPTGAAPVVVPAVTIARADVERSSATATYLRVELATTGAADGTRVRLATVRSSLRFPDGTIVRSAESNGYRMGDARPALPQIQSWIGTSAPERYTTVYGAVFTLTAAQRRALLDHRAQIDVEGTLEIATSREVARWTSASTRQIVTAGQRLTAAPVPDELAPSIRIDADVVLPSFNSETGPWVLIGSLLDDPRSLVAVHRHTGAARMLHSTDTESRGSGLVLPSSSVVRLSQVFTVGTDGPSSTWFRDADVVLIAWQPVARTAMTLRAPVRAPESPVVADAHTDR